MGIFIDYAFRAVGSEEELFEILRKLRARLVDLPLRRVGEVQRIEPIFDPIVFDRLLRRGLPLPAPVMARIGRWLDDQRYGDLCLCFGASPVPTSFPRAIQDRFLKPVRALVDRTDLWNPSDYPEEFEIGPLKMNRKYLFLLFASALILRGYLMIIDPGEGCESVTISLSTFGKSRPLWLGESFTKTQYATHFTQVHENVCSILDAAREAGILFKARDTCGFYEHRDWTRSAHRVNRETIAATLVSRILDQGIDAARRSGLEVETIQSPASRCTNIIRPPARPGTTEASRSDSPR